MKGGTTRIPDERIFSSFPKNKLIYEKKRKPTIHYINLNHGLKDEHSVYPFFSSLSRSVIFFLTINNTEDDSGNLAIVKKQIKRLKYIAKVEKLNAEKYLARSVSKSRANSEETRLCS